MSTALRLTVDEYDQMVAEGAFDSLYERRIELIHGELCEMSPQGPPHIRAIIYLTRWSTSNTSPEEVDVRIQAPIRIPLADSEPEPDVAWCQPAVDLSRHPEPSEVLLLIEVAESTLRYDLGRKARLYSRAGIADYWVVDTNGRMLYVHRQPGPSGYQDVNRLPLGGTASPLCFPNVVLHTAELFAR